MWPLTRRERLGFGSAGAWMTAALGGVCIEKHYTLDPDLPDIPDHKLSVTPPELAEMVPERQAEFPHHAALIARYASHFNASIPGPVPGRCQARVGVTGSRPRAVPPTRFASRAR